MGVKDRAALAEYLRSYPRPTDIIGRRVRFDEMCERFPVSRDVTVEVAHVGGVSGEWVRGVQSCGDAALLFLHGGAYVIGSPKSHRHLAAALSTASGLPVFSADYRLAPEHPFPAAVDDAVAAYRGLLDSGIAAEKLAVAGDSAGGGLAIAMLVAARDSGLPMPACAISVSGWLDLTQSNDSHQLRATRDPTISTDRLNAMAAAYLSGKSAATPLASPAYADLRGLPPILLQVGTEEVLHDDTIKFAARATNAGVEVSLESWGGMIHAWPMFHPLLSEGRDAIARMGSYLRGHIDCSKEG